MTRTIENIWEAIAKLSLELQKSNDNIVFDAGKKDIFVATFEEYYTEIMDNHMYETTALDAHKIAAIIIVSILQNDVLIIREYDQENIFIGEELVAISVALSYMRDRLNEKLIEKQIEKQIDKYKLPIAFACDTPYVEVWSRLLYIAKNKEKPAFNILDLSDKLFLLEYITILEAGIEPLRLK